VRCAVIGHVEWIEFARVPRLPVQGEIVHTLGTFEAPGGGGAVTAVQLARLAGGATFYTALGDDDAGRRAHAELVALGLTVEVAWREPPQRRAFVFVDDDAERTITVMGERVGPSTADDLPWDDLAGMDAVYFTAGDTAAVRAARAAGTLVATARALGALTGSGAELDALVASAKDAGERYEPGSLDPEPRLVVRTAGAAGGEWRFDDGTSGRFAAAPLPGPPVDFYGCGDSFAGGLTFGLGAGMKVAEAIDLGARCGAACATGAGPYGNQLDAEAV
jgi:ribokinase